MPRGPVDPEGDPRVDDRQITGPEVHQVLTDQNGHKGVEYPEPNVLHVFLQVPFFSGSRGPSV